MKQAFCQDSVADQEMRKSGQDLKSAAAATGESAEHAFHGTADQMRDATLTTKIKSAYSQILDSSRIGSRQRYNRRYSRITLQGQIRSIGCRVSKRCSECPEQTDLADFVRVKQKPTPESPSEMTAVSQS
jgi:hypothetical protein